MYGNITMKPLADKKITNPNLKDIKDIYILGRCKPTSKLS
jgi:hypothetical protein